MKLFLLSYFFVAGLSSILATHTKSANETDLKTLETVDFAEVESENEPVEAQRKRDSGYTYNKPIRFNRPRLNSGLRGRFSKNPNRFKRPFNQYGLPATSQEQSLNQQRPHNQYSQPNQLSSDNLHNQGVPSPIRYVDFSETNPIASQNNEPFRIGTANYLPPKNQKLPDYAAPDVFTTLQQESFQGNQNQQINQNYQISQNQQKNHQNVLQENFQDQRISDAALFLSQNAHTLSQLYGAPASNQEYAPNNEYVNEAHQSPDQQNFDNNLHSQTENLHVSQGSQGSQEFRGPLPSYASGILSSQETLRNIQSLEKDRLISQLQQALINQAQLQNSENLASNFPTQEARQQIGRGPANPGEPQLVSPSAFGGEQSVFGHTPFLSGSAISPPGYGLGYGPSTTGQGTTAPPTTTTTSQPTGPIGGGSRQPGSVLPEAGSFPSTLSGFPQFSTYIPTLIPGTNFVANVPSFGHGFLSPGSVSTPNHPAASSPTHFGIPIPTFPGQKPVPGSPIFIGPSASPARPGVQILTPGDPLLDPLKPVHPSSDPSHPVGPPVHPVNSPAHPAHPVGNPSHPVQPGLTGPNPIHPIANPPHSVSIHPVASPVLPIGTLRPITAPAYPSGTPVHPTYGVQPSFVKTLFIKPLKTVFPVYYYPNGPLQLPKPGLATQPWNYAPTFQLTKPAPTWKR